MKDIFTFIFGKSFILDHIFVYKISHTYNTNQFETKYQLAHQ